MEIEEKSLKNMMMINVINWLILILIIKFFKPEYCNLSELIIGILKKREITALFYVVLMITYIITTYILAIMSVYVIGYMTIGKVIRFIKEFLNVGARYMEQNMYYESEYSYSGIVLIATYVFLILPIMLYILWPALSVILIIVLIFLAIVNY
ncbi:hypothetical protein [Lacrimispora xylanisolvens]|uniref:hypothetical protein n=1 Tax=Lacrimispora xylanisolvens TaxID=384636 RepID=UPI002402BFD9